MVIKPDFNRFLKAINHEEADRIPLCEAIIHYDIQSRFLGRQVTPDDLEAQVEFWTKAGYDFFPLPVSLMTPGKVTEESTITKLLKEMVLAKNPGETNPKAWNLEVTPFIHEREDFESFPWEAAAEMDFGPLDRIGELLPEGMKVVAISGKIFTLTWMLMGFQNFGIKLIKEPELTGDVFRRVAEIQFSALDKILAKEYVGAVWLIDDLAFGTGPMISPRAFREHVFPWYKKMSGICHRAGRPLIFHSDGDLEMIMADLIDIGIDMLQPIDPTCMDIFAVKQKYGDKIALAGNVSNQILAEGTPAEICEYVKELIKRCGPGGGYFVGSGNSVPDWAQYENYMAMRETVLKHGQYPINS